MAEYGGISEFMAALTGREGLEQDAYDAELKRLVTARSAQAVLDKRLEEAAQARMATDALEGIAADPTLSQLARNVTIGKRGTDFSGAMRGEGYQQQNQARDLILAEVQTALAAGEPIPADLINALAVVSSGGKLSPTNVNVRDQALAREALTEAQTALAGERATTQQATTALREAQTTAAGAREAAQARKFSETDKIQLFSTTDAQGVQRLDPQKFSRFVSWQADQRMIDPRYNDDYTAYTLYRKGISAKDLQGQSAMPDVPETPAPSTGAEVYGEELLNWMAPNRQEAIDALTGEAVNGAPVDTTVSKPESAAPATVAGQSVPYNQADVEILINAANQAVAAGKDPAEVRRRLEAELAKMGVTLEQ
jgi:hypothetical protein